PQRQRRRAARAGGRRAPLGRDGARDRSAADPAPAFSGIGRRGHRRVLAGAAGVREARRLFRGGALVRHLHRRAAAGSAGGRRDRAVDGGAPPWRRPRRGPSRRRPLPAALPGRTLRGHGESNPRRVTTAARSALAATLVAAALTRFDHPAVAAEPRLRVLIVIDESDDPFAERIRAEV